MNRLRGHANQGMPVRKATRWNQYSRRYLDGRAMSDGFEENAAYFKLDFLDPGDVTRGRKVRVDCADPLDAGRLPRGVRSSKGSGKWFIPKHNPFAVLLDEDAFGDFVRKLAERPDIDHVFLVTDSTEGLSRDGRRSWGRTATSRSSSTVPTSTRSASILPSRERSRSAACPSSRPRRPRRRRQRRRWPMRISLKDFQVGAADELIQAANGARRAGRKQPQAVSSVRLPVGQDRHRHGDDRTHSLRPRSGPRRSQGRLSVAVRFPGAERAIQEQDRGRGRQAFWRLAR